MVARVENAKPSKLIFTNLQLLFDCNRKSINVHTHMPTHSPTHIHTHLVGIQINHTLAASDLPND